MKVDGTVASITYHTYDANGNQIKTVTDGKTTILYDEFNQLISQMVLNMVITLRATG